MDSPFASPADDLGQSAAIGDGTTGGIPFSGYRFTCHSRKITEDCAAIPIAATSPSMEASNETQ
jgi:hypothetical protein